MQNQQPNNKQRCETVPIGLVTSALKRSLAFATMPAIWLMGV